MYKFLFFIVLIQIGCQSKPAPTPIETADTTARQATPLAEEPADTQPRGYTQAQLDSLFQLPDSTWVDIALLDPSIEMDIRYATENNFMKKQVYDCGKCYLRLLIAKKVLEMQKELKTKGLGFKMYDCYRPRSVQWELWKITPDPRYVADPRKGSAHNRGSTMDLTLVDSLGNELDMGTPFDFFGKEAYWSYTGHSPQVNANRKILRDLLYARGFKAASTEWWHFSYQLKSFPLSDMRWSCAE